MMKMRTFEMVRGCVTVNFAVGGDQILLNGRQVTADAMNAEYRKLRKLGFKVVKPETAPIEAPKKPERLSKEQTLTERYGDKEARRLYKRTEAYYTSVARRATDPKLPIKEFRDRVAVLVEEAMKTWESNGRPDVIVKLGR